MHLIKLHLLTLTLVLTGFLIGCATAPQPAGPVSAEQQKRLLAQDHWHITGKLGYRGATDGGSAWLDWRQRGQIFNLSLHGPFGAGATQILGTDSGATLLRSGKEPIFADSATSLTDYLFGWQWPVDELLFWIRGIPAPRAPVDSASYDDRQLLTGLQQSGWRLQFSNHLRTTEGLVVPGKITGHFRQVSFTLVIKEWQPLEEADG